jgi:hypothetical protein
MVMATRLRLSTIHKSITCCGWWCWMIQGQYGHARIPSCVYVLMRLWERRGMALRDCKHCWKTVDDEKHYWFCPFGDGVHPSSTKKSQRGSDASGSGGGEPGESNIPPLPDAPGGGGASVPRALESMVGRGTVDLGELMRSPAEPATIENQPALALPAPLEVEDEQKLRRDSMGKRRSSADLV